MDVEPYESPTGQVGLMSLRLDDEPERAAVTYALNQLEGVWDVDRILYAYLGSLTGSVYPQRIVVSGDQLGRILKGMDELLTATQQMGDADAEIDVLTMAEIIRPHVPPPREATD